MYRKSFPVSIQDGQKQHAALSTLNQAMPFIVKELEQESFHVHLTDGFITGAYREAHGIDQDHKLDAYCIACSILARQTSLVSCSNTYRIRQFRRYERKITKRGMLDRKYLDEKNRVVARNRYRAFERIEPSDRAFIRRLCAYRR